MNKKKGDGGDPSPITTVITLMVYRVIILLDVPIVVNDYRKQRH